MKSASTPGRADPAGEPTERQSPWQVGNDRARARRQLLTGLTVLSLIVLALFGLPTGREVVSLWVLALLFCLVGGDARAWRRAVLTDWLPLLAALFAYDWLRGIADTAAGRTLFEPQIAVDRILFAGQVPTVWLQERLLRADPAWYDVAIVPVYLSHFVVPLAVAAGLWARNYVRFRRYVRTLLTLTAATLLTYALLPAAPPWLASRSTDANGQAFLPPVERVISRTLLDSDIPTIHSAVQRGEAYANPVAAVPSLHAAIPMLVLLTFWPALRRTGRALLVSYVLLMGFTLVYGGEHYVADILLGWAYAALASFATSRAAARTQWPGRWQRRGPTVAGPEAPAGRDLHHHPAPTQGRDR